MKRYFYILSFAFCLLPFSAGSLLAQTGTCEQSTGEAYLDAGNVRARIFNNGALFWRGSPATYEVPRGDSTNAIFAGNIWVAGLVEGELRTALTEYGPWEFWPGPLDATGNPPVDCAVYDRLWEITRSDLDALAHTDTPTQNLLEWPWQLGAPVVDGDGIPNNYDLQAGDRPELLGDQRLWWIMNDSGNIHEKTKSEPLGLEIQASAFIFNHPEFFGDDTFYTYRLINKRAQTISDAFFSVFLDTDLGNFNDDYLGSDSLLHLGYTYNADNFDENGVDRKGYGQSPPALGVTYLKTAVADQDGLDNDRDGMIDNLGEMLGTSSVFGFGVTFRHFCDVCADPDSSGYYEYMKARVRGEPMREGGYGFGYTEGATTRFLFSGDATTQSFWSEFNAYGDGRASGVPRDRSLLVSTGPFTLGPGDSLDVAFALIWARGHDNLDSINKLKGETSRIREFTDMFLSPFPVLGTETLSPLPRHVLGFDQNFPNPFSQTTTLRYSLPQSMQVRLAVYDILGRQVDLLVDAQQDAGIYTIDFDAGNWPAGVYLARIELDHLRFTKRMIRVP